MDIDGCGECIGLMNGRDTVEFCGVDGLCEPCQKKYDKEMDMEIERYNELLDLEKKINRSVSKLMVNGRTALRVLISSNPELEDLYDQFIDSWQDYCRDSLLAIGKCIKDPELFEEWYENNLYDKIPSDPDDRLDITLKEIPVDLQIRYINSIKSHRNEEN